MLHCRKRCWIKAQHQGCDSSNAELTRTPHIAGANLPRTCFNVPVVEPIITDCRKISLPPEQ